MSLNTTFELSTIEHSTIEHSAVEIDAAELPPTLPCSPVAPGTPTVILGTPSALLEESTLSPTLSLETPTVLLGTPTDRLHYNTVGLEASAVAAPSASTSRGFTRVFFMQPELFFQLATALTAIWMVDQDSLDLGTILVVCRETWGMRLEMRRSVQHTVAHGMSHSFRVSNVPTALQWLQLWRTYPQVPVLLPNGVDATPFEEPAQPPPSVDWVNTRKLINIIVAFIYMNGVLNNLIRRGVFARSENREAALALMDAIRAHYTYTGPCVRRQLLASLEDLLRNSFAVGDVSNVHEVPNGWLNDIRDFTTVVVTGVQLTVSDSDIEHCNASLPEGQKLQIHRS
jgi:hypothetical protein